MTEESKNPAQEALERLLSKLSAAGIDRNEVLLALTAHSDMAFFSRYKPVVENMLRAALDQAAAARQTASQPQQGQAASLVDILNGNVPAGKVVVAEQVTPSGAAPSPQVASLAQLAPVIESIARAITTFKQTGAPAFATAIDAMRPAFEMFNAFLEFQRSTEARILAGMRARGVPVPQEPGSPQQPPQSVSPSTLPSEIDRMAKTNLPPP